MTYTYDSNKRLSTVTDAKNQQKVMTYDTLSRVTQVQRYIYSSGAYVEAPMARTNFYCTTSLCALSGTLRLCRFYFSDRLAVGCLRKQPTGVGKKQAAAGL